MTNNWSILKGVSMHHPDKSEIIIHIRSRNSGTNVKSENKKKNSAFKIERVEHYQILMSSEFEGCQDT